VAQEAMGMSHATLDSRARVWLGNEAVLLPDRPHEIFIHRANTAHHFQISQSKESHTNHHERGLSLPLQSFGASASGEAPDLKFR